MTSRIAPFALLRLAGVAHPAPPRVADAFRAALNTLTRKETELAGLAGPVADALYASAAGHSLDFHQRVVLPLRRDVHNGRTPRETLLAVLADLPARLPELDRWLRLRAEANAVVETLVAAWPDALAAERTLLAEVAAAEPLRRASVLTGRDLLYGLERTARAGGEPDKKARKSEATVLRYALRATAKTSPLSWYTSVGWGHWATEDALPAGEPAAIARVNRVLLARLTAALLADLPGTLPHRLAPALSERDGRLHFRRDIPVTGAARAYIVKEESVDLALTGPLRFVVDAVRDAGPKGITPDDLAQVLADRLPDDQSARVSAFLGKLLGVGLLIPVEPVAQQDPDAVASLAGWLRDRGEPGTAGKLLALEEATTGFATLDATDRPARLSELDAGWRALGEATGADLTGVPPLTEDVYLPGTARLGPAHGSDATDTLARLTPLLMLFDRQLLIRRYARDRFIDRFGKAGAASPADCADLLSTALQQTIAGPENAEAAEIAAHRRRLVTRAGTDGEITDDLIDEAEALLPAWARTRPVSYSFFFQPLPDGGVVVNHLYAGFGRFTSRFLDGFGPSARTEVAEHLREFLGDFAQYRPVYGFTANLHPLVGALDVGEDARWADRAPDEFDVCHDPEADELRLRDRRTGRFLDVLYPGFLMPLILPDRVAALYTDLACGWTDLDALRPSTKEGGVTTQGRLRYRNVLLSRKSWTFGEEATGELRTAFGASEAGQAVAAARVRARHELPEHVFAGPGETVTSMEEFNSRIGAPKPQYVDFGNALHLRHLPRLLTRHEAVRLTEALPVPHGRVTEVIAESYYRGRTS